MDGVDPIAQLERLKLNRHRQLPSRPLLNENEAADYVREQKIVTLMGRAGLANLADAIVGRRIRGSWMADPEVKRIYGILERLSQSHIFQVRLIAGRWAAVTESLVPSVIRYALDQERRRAVWRSLPAPARALLEEVEKRECV